MLAQASAAALLAKRLSRLAIRKADDAVQLPQRVCDQTNATKHFQHGEQIVEIQKEGHRQQNDAAQKRSGPDDKSFFGGIHGIRPRQREMITL